MAQTVSASQQPVDNYYIEQRIASRDGTSLFVRRWLPQSQVKGHVLILHGYMDHGGRYAEVGRALAARGLAATAIDFRGHGKSEGQRGYIASFQQYLDDMRAGLGLLDDPKFILAHSNGGLVSLDYLSTNNPGLAGVVLTNPFLAQTTPAKGLKLAIGQFAGRYLPRLSLPSGLKAEELSSDPEIIRAHGRDPLIFNNANAGWFREATAAQARVRNLTEFPAPLLYVYSNTDPVASPVANQQLSGQLKCADKTVEVRQNEVHEVLNEKNRAQLHTRIGDWMLKHLPA